MIMMMMMVKRKRFQQQRGEGAADVVSYKRMKDRKVSIRAASRVGGSSRASSPQSCEANAVARRAGSAASCAASFVAFLVLGLVSPTAADQGQITEQAIPLYRIYGAAEEDNFGVSVAGVGDINGDHYGDLLIGAWRSDQAGNNAGEATLISGRTRQPIETLVGERPGDSFGFGLTALGDVNGDDVPDFAVGAHFHDGSASNAGRVYVYSGVDRRIICIFDGEARDDRFGRNIAAAGDVDGDGLNDIIIGANYNDRGGSDAGAAYVISCANGGRLIHAFYGREAGQHFGRSVSGGADADGDGVPDLLVGAPKTGVVAPSAGAVYVYSGASGELIASYFGDETNERFGRSVAMIGDIDGDLLAEFAIGAPEHTGFASRVGRVAIFDIVDRNPVIELEGESIFEGFGKRVAAAGDVDGDGTTDITIGGQGNRALGPNTGRAYVFSGRTGELIFSATGEAEGDLMGSCVGAAGDVNNDGIGDVIFGADSNNANGIDAGATYVYLGGRSDYRLVVDDHRAGEIATFVVTGGRPFLQQTLLTSVNGLGDIVVRQLNTTIDLARPQVLRTGIADRWGTISWSLRLNTAAMGRLVFYQAVQIGRSTNVICREIR
ncbi:MAG: hypothetical protein ACOC0P_01665 [Planctomycetota bacterium]